MGRGVEIGRVGVGVVLLADVGKSQLLCVFRLRAAAWSLRDRFFILYAGLGLVSHQGVGFAELFLRDVERRIDFQREMILIESILVTASEAQHFAIGIMRVRFVGQERSILGNVFDGFV